MPPEEYDLIASRAELVELKQEERIYAPKEEIKFVYFPLTCLLSWVTVTEAGTLTATLGQDLMNNDPDCVTPGPECWANDLYVRQGNCMSGTEVACGGFAITGVTTLTFAVTPGIYYFFVDGRNFESYSAGPYVLRLEMD